MNQKDRLLQYLEKHGTITTLESVMQLGIMDPQHYIMELRNENYNITDQWINGTNRVGRKIRYKRYRLEKDNDRG